MFCHESGQKHKCEIYDAVYCEVKVQLTIEKGQLTIDNGKLTIGYFRIECTEVVKLLSLRDSPANPPRRTAGKDIIARRERITFYVKGFSIFSLRKFFKILPGLKCIFLLPAT